MADVLSVIADVLKNDKQQKREQAKIMREVQKKLKEKDSEEVAEEPGDKEDYMKFFAGKLKKYGVKSPSELDAERKKKFFNEIEKDWKHDSNEEVEDKDLGKRVKARMEAEDEVVVEPDDEEEDEDEAPVGDPDDPDTEPEEEEEENDDDDDDDDEPSEDQIDKIADLVVQKLKDKADEEEEEEQEPDPTEAEGGKEEEIDTKPKVENLHRNPHRKSVWIDALRKVHEWQETTEEKPQQLDEHKGTKPHKHPHDDEEGLEERYKVGRTTYKNRQEYEKAIDAVKEPDMKDLHPLVRKSMKKVKKEEDTKTGKDDDSIEGPAKGVKHKCPTHVKKEGFGYGKNISHTLSDNVVDKMNIYWYDSKEVSYMMPISEVEVVEGSYHNMKNHREKFKSTEKIAEELRKQPNPFEKIKEDMIQCPECDQMHEDDACPLTMKEGNDKPIEDAAKKVQHNWKRMSKRDKVKFKDKMDDLASKNRVSDADLEEILDDYGLTEGNESIGMSFLRKHKTKDKQ